MKRSLLLALSLLAGAPALAQEYDTPPSGYDRPHSWRAELRFSTVYYPAVDDNLPLVTVYPDGVTPSTGGAFGEVFGTRRRLLSEGEFDRDLWKGFGTVGVGVGFAYAEFYGTGFHNLAAAGQLPFYAGSGDGTGFHLGQLRLVALYRFDEFVPRGFPLVPFAKVGLDWAYYWEQLSSGQLTPNQKIGTGDAQGMVTGVEASLGLSLLLDFVDPVIAREMYQDLGVAHTYLNASYTWQDLQNGPSNLLHSIFEGGNTPTTLNLSSQFFDFGVSVEF